ncbi:MAG: hypothetical protein DRP01_01005 [Archaeoglobales archaeon]|nr:MAG: hypothetical protein DRP01_01005 [Archaeoglobales archaeon]
MIKLVDPDEVLSFLARAWSEDKETLIRRDSWFFANVESKIIFLPSYFQKLPMEKHMNLANIRRWRFYRFSAWHEAQHIRFSPFKQEIIPKIEEKLEKMGFSVKGSLVEALVDVFEDYRIEKLGLRDYKYEEEKRFVDEIGRIASEKAFEKIADEWNIYSAVLTGYLLFDAKIPNTVAVDPAFLQALDEVKENMLKIETVEDLEDAVVKSYPLLHEHWPKYITCPDARGIRLVGATLIFEGNVKLDAEIPEEIKEEFRTMMKSIQKFNEEMRDLQKLASSLGGKVQTELGDWNLIYDPVRTYAEILKNQLTKWKVGWVEHLSHVGDDIEPESYLLSRYYDSYEKPKFLIDEEQLSQKADLLLLVDMSGSIDQHLELYKRSLAVITSALDYVGTKFSLFTFSGKKISVIKDLSTPFDIHTKERVAGLEASGGTPLGHILRVLNEKYLGGIDRIVVVTDGFPDNPKVALEEIKRIRERGKKLGVMLLQSEEVSNLIGFDLYREFESLLSRIPNSYIRVGSVKELPLQFFRLLMYMR